MASSGPHPIFNTTYTLYRLTPLHNFPNPVTPRALNFYAKSLLSILRGDVLRGVRVVADDGDPDHQAVPTTGALKNVSWVASDPLPWEGDAGKTGIKIQVVYEKITYSALLLPSSDQDLEMDEMRHFPLLMVRMPKGLRETLLRYLESSFDTLSLPVRLYPRILISALEKYLERIFDDGTVTTNVQLTFSVPLVANPGLKTVAMTILREDVEEFYMHGVNMLRSRKDATNGPFFEALREYAYENMGCKIEDLRLSKVACGAFVIGIGTGDVCGRVKIFEPSATKRRQFDDAEKIDGEEQMVGDFVASLIRTASGEEQEDSSGVGDHRDGSVEL